VTTTPTAAAGGFELLHGIETRVAWRQWLHDNHKTSKGVLLVFWKKKSGRPVLQYDHCVEEALCFGWIDSTRRTLDDDRHTLAITPRKSKSVRSKLNKHRVGKLEEQNLMAEAGKESVRIAKENGTWTSLDEVEALTIPDDLQEAFDENPTALENFNSWNKSRRKMLLYRIAQAKRAETRQKRIKEAVLIASQNEK
jgi:uncharacterized protein YdeI (YjbR/CyaY-like superfamily)